MVLTVCAQENLQTIIHPLKEKVLTMCDSAYLKNTTTIETNDSCLKAGADYVLSCPLHGNPAQHDHYMQFIQSWMEKTPDFTFNLNDKILNLCKKDNLLLFNIYLACLTKAAIEERKADSHRAIRLFAAYVQKPENRVKQTARIKKLIADVANNEIQKYL
jgi:hypothetical protein